MPGDVDGPGAPGQVDLPLGVGQLRAGRTKRRWLAARAVSRLGAPGPMRSKLVHSTSIYDRFYFLATFAVAYVALASMQQVGVSLERVLVLGLGPVVLAVVWRHTRQLQSPTAPELEGVAAPAVRAAAFGASLWLAARSGPSGRPAFDLAAALGLGTAIVAACVAIARIPHAGGLIKPSRSARSLDAAAFCALLWGVAAALPGARTFWPAKNLLLDPLATDYATSAASIASVLVLIAAALRARVSRRLELGVLDRASGALALALTCFSVAVPAALIDLAAPDRALPFGALGAALATVWAATTREPTAVSSSLRGALVVMALGAPVALSTAVIAKSAPETAGVVALVGCSAALLVGLVARAVARPLAPEQSRWLAALTAATRAALEPEPNAAIVATLASLQKLEESARTRPELWRIDPPEVLSVDLAGYLHTEPGSAPPELYELARSEPERLLRRDVLAALEVRRPDVRDALAWLDSRGAFAVTLVSDDEAPLGLLMLPRGSRTRPATLEEARAARKLGDRLSAVLAVSSSLARMRLRESEAARRSEQMAAELDSLRGRLTHREKPRHPLVETLAQRVRAAAYSARARSLLEQLQRAASAGTDLALRVPVGIDPLPYACAYHVASSRARGPLVVVDGTLAAAAVPRDPALSPGLRAAGGTLCVLHAAALPLAAQDALAIELSRRGPTSAEDAALLGDFGFAFLTTLSAPPEVLVERRELSRALAQFLIGRELSVPALAERPEDLRGLILERLCQTGERRAGAPLGIDLDALRLLVDHDWPGNDAELFAVIDRAAQHARGERVGVADLEAAGFEPEALEGPAESADRFAAAPRRRSERVRAQPETDAEALRPARRRRRR